MTLDRFPERLLRCIAGLACFGVGISLFVASDLGVPPWDVFHQGLAELTGLPMGTVIIGVGFALLLLWIPLRQRPGLGTLLNAVEIGLVVNLTIDHVPHPGNLFIRALYVIAGLLVVGIGSGLYIGAGLGAGPRDGLMMGLAQRGVSVRVARTGLEAVVLVLGMLLGGSFGVGTLAFALGIGPVVHVTIPRLAMRPAEGSLVSAADQYR
jgi:uncharacterized membrane protein YczE